MEASIPEELALVVGKHGGVRVSGPLCHAFIDESGTVAPFSGSHFLVIALLGTTRPRQIELHVKRAFKKYERGDNSFYEVIADKVVVEEVISRRLW